MWVEDSVRKLCLCVKAPLCKDSPCKSFCVFSLLGKCFFHECADVGSREIKNTIWSSSMNVGRDLLSGSGSCLDFAFCIGSRLCRCASLLHPPGELERNADDQLLVDALRDTARQRPHISSSFILNHQSFFTILFWSTPSFSFGPKLSSMETKAAVNTHLLMWAKIKMDAYLYPVNFSKVCSKIWQESTPNHFRATGTMQVQLMEAGCFFELPQLETSSREC